MAGGNKISGSDYEGQLIFWILEDPSIADYRLCKMLEEECKVKVSSPTMKVWRKNHFPSDKDTIEDIRKTFEKRKENTDNYNRSLADKVHNTIDRYLHYIEMIERRVEFFIELSDKKMAEQQQRSVRVYPDIDVERLIGNYTRILDTLNSHAFKFTGGAEYVTQLQDLVTEVATSAIAVFLPHITEENKDACRRDFKNAIDSIESKLYDRLPKELSKIKSD